MTDAQSIPPQALTGKRILITGPTSQVGEPVAKAMAAANEVIGVARFTNPKARKRLEAAGVQCISADLATGALDDLPEDVDYVCNFAVARSNDWDADLSANAESVGLLMDRYRDATAF
ncbi:MAG: NAD-dependent epimerase/dehydratase family protein, partial [Acidimicrobiales bacterium]